MRRMSTTVGAVVLVAILFGCGPKKPFARQLSAVASSELRVASLVPSPESRSRVGNTSLQSSGVQLD
jgi:hypothetical protein